MKYLLLLFSILFFSNYINAQKEANQWYFEQFNGLDFNGDTVKFLNGCAFGKNESSSTFCDSNGNILFYSNGITLYNKYHKIVKNGTNLGFSVGVNETSSYQGTLLLKHPDNDSLVYLFSTDNQGRGGGLVYAIINKHGNKDSGEVLQKKIKLYNSVNESIQAINHQNGKDIWIICHQYGSDKFISYLLNKHCLINCPIENTIGAMHYNGGSDAQVPLKISSNGKYITHSQQLWGNTETFYLNTETGLIKDTLILNTLNIVFGIEYSPNNKYLYIIMSDSGLAQINLITKKRIILNNFNQNKIPVQIQLASDGKIYGSIYNSKDLFIIDKPNLEGNASNIIIKKDFLEYNNIVGLPNFNQSYFYTPAINYNYEMECINNSVQFWGKDTFRANTHKWQTKKVYSVNSYLLIGSTKDINYTFTDTGKYEVRYIADNGTRKDTIVKTIMLYPKINKQFLGKDTTYIQGSVINKTLQAAIPNHCVSWQDTSSLSTYTATKKGIYTCKVTNQAFCEVIDTIEIKECLSLAIPSIYKRLTDSIFCTHPLADTFIWYRNNVPYKTTYTNGGDISSLKLTDTGTYRAEAVKYGHCNRTSSTFNINKLGVRGIRIQDLGIKVFPNPSSGVLNIESEKNYKLKITDLIGRTILETENVKQVYLVKEVYYFRFEVEGSFVTEKVVVL